MKMILSLFLFILISNTINACDISFKVLGSKSMCYSKGDIVKVEVLVDFIQEKCTDNTDKTFVYRKGLKTIEEGEWIIEGTKARKILTLEVIGTKKGDLMLTASRRTTKDECFEQYKLKMCTFSN